MTDAVVETLRLRGPNAARLTRVAATALPAALERAFVDVPDARLNSLSVRLELDLSEYDDTTLATLWADAIRVELLRHLPADARPASRLADRPGVSPGVGSRGFPLESVVAAARNWLAQGAPRGPVPAAALALAQVAVEDTTSANAGTGGDIARLVLALDEAVTARSRAVATNALLRDGDKPLVAPSELGNDANATAAHIAPSGTGQPSPQRAAEPPHETAPSVGHPNAALASAAAARVAALAALAPAAAGSVDLDAVSNAAGLALMYPWLADCCRTATTLHPGLDEAAVRTFALATLVDPNDPALLADPLILFLAGAREPVAQPVRLAHEAEVRAQTDTALISFASLLPGFAQSSPDFVRGEWIRRIGLLDAERDPALLTAATHPLDVLLTRLPYPLALFKLPWSPPLSVRFRP